MENNPISDNPVKVESQKNLFFLGIFFRNNKLKPWIIRIFFILLAYISYKIRLLNIIFEIYSPYINIFIYFSIFLLVFSISGLYLLMNVKIKGEGIISKNTPKLIQKVLVVIYNVTLDEELYEQYKNLLILWIIMSLFYLILLVI